MPEEKDAKISETAKKVSEVLGDLKEDTKSGSGFGNFLKELDVSKKQFFTFLLIVVIFVCVIVYSFYAIFKVFKPESEELDFRDQVQEQQKREEPEAVVEKKLNKDLAPPSNVAPIKIKFDFLKVPLLLGAKTSDQVNTDSMALVFSKAKNLYEVDVYAFLDNFENREQGFKEYVLKLEAALAEVGVLLADLKREVLVLEKTLQDLNDRAVQAEQDFFEASDNLLIGKIDKNLLLFQSINVRIAELKPLLQARNVFIKRFEDVVKLVPQKLAAVKANEDAFVKAVKLQNVENFDLNLIENN